MRRIIVSESVSVDGVFDAQTMGQWAVPYYSKEREEIIKNSMPKYVVTSTRSPSALE